MNYKLKLIIMRIKLFIPVALVATAAMVTSCSKKLGALTSENFKVNPTPLTLKGNSVEATVYGAFPEKYMNKKAVVTVTPELRGTDGTVVRGEGTTFQGEKVNGNDQTVSYLIGGHYTMRDVFPYTESLRNSELFLTFDAKIGKKAVKVPAVKVGYGVLSTTALYREALQQGGGIIAPDTFQYVRQMRQEASINFLVNQAELRKSELENNSVQAFIALLDRINKDAESYNIGDVEVLAYASPEGRREFNDQLAGKRQRASEQYVDEQLKKNNLSSSITGEYTAEDWEGFQKLVMASDIQDKELILRVLNMYKDPQEREEQIRNLSKGFQDLADQILPQLRRARMIINYESVGRSDEQIEAQYNADPAKLSADELLYYATLVEDIAAKEDIYKKCAQLYPQDYRAFNNIAAMEYAKGNWDAARQYINKAIEVSPRNGESQANLAMLALQNGDIQQAEAYMAKAANSASLNEVQGAVNFVKGNYTQAAQNYKNVYNNMAALAQIQAQDYAQARATFKQIKNPDATTDYLHAILTAREGNKYATNSYLKDALKKDPSLQKKIDTDLEFSNLK